MTDIMWALAEQWRGILSVALIFALLLSGIKYVKSVSAYRTASAQTQAETEVTTSDGEESSLQKVMTFYKQWQDRKTYFEESALMQSDASNQRRLTLNYRVKTESSAETDALSIADIYYMFLGNDIFLEQIAEACGLPDVKGRDMREMCWVPQIQQIGTRIQNDCTTLTVNIIIPENADYNAVADAVDRAFNEKRDQIIVKTGDFSISRVDEDLSVYTDTITISMQADAYSKMLAAETTYKTEYGKLRGDEKATMDQLIREGDAATWLSNRQNDFVQDEVEEEQTAAIDENPVKPGFPYKYAVMGFFMGFILYAGIYLCWLAFRNRVRNEKEITYQTGIRAYGAICEYPYKGFVQRFLHDRMIYEWRHKKDGTASETSANIARTIAAKAAHMDVSDVALIVLGEPSVWVDRLLSKQVKILKEEKGIDAVKIIAEKGVSSINEETIAGMGPVILAVLSNITTPIMAADFLDRLGEYGVPVIGTEFLEGC